MIQYLTQTLSYLVGKSAEIPVPPFLRPLVYEVVTKSLSIDPAEAQISLLDFPSVQALFTRKLKSEARKPPVAGENTLSSPCDGTLRRFGKVASEHILLVKDRPLSVAALLDDSTAAIEFNDGYFYNLYLSPKDYHRVHTPAPGLITEIKRVPGSLLPVADWSVSRWPELFARNERVIFSLENGAAKYKVIMVGALNVGGIIPSVETSQTVAAGQELGVFELGSSVILLCNRPVQPVGEENRQVKVFENIGII